MKVLLSVSHDIQPLQGWIGIHGLPRVSLVVIEIEPFQGFWLFLSGSKCFTNN
jgi:hypothetical protein